MISIIIPVYRVAPYLGQCIKSIIGQTYRDIEILLIDDGSPDECGKICEEYKNRDSRIKVIHTENQGLSAARNRGLENATGEYIGFVDSDDWIEPDMYEVLLKRIKDNSISVCGYDTAFQKDGLKKGVYFGSDALRALLKGEINNNVWNKLYHKELFNDICFPEGKNYEDVVVMHKLVEKAKSIAVVPDVFYHYRVRPESITKTYTANNLIDYADAHLSRYYYFRDEHTDLFSENEEVLLGFAANGISKVWRWWHGCSQDENKRYDGRINELYTFTKENIPLLGLRSWSSSMRLSALFMHSQNMASFALLYYMNQIYRKLWPEKGNVVVD